MESVKVRYSVYLATVLLYLFLVLAMELMFRYSANQFLQVITLEQLVVSFSGLFAAVLVPGLVYALLCFLLFRLSALASPWGKAIMAGVVRVVLWAPFGLLMAGFFRKWVYTTFRTGAIEASSYSGLVTIGFTGVVLSIVWLRQAEIMDFVSRTRRKIFVGWALLMAPFWVSFLLEAYSWNRPFESSDKAKASHIIIAVSGESLVTERMSLYDYHRDTTPFLARLARQSYVFDRVYSSATKSRPSIVTMLTGKSILNHRVIENNDALTGTDQFESLPGVLNAMGYYNADFTLLGSLGHIGWRIAYVTNPADYNMADGFDMINGTEKRTPDSVRKVFASLSRTNISVYWAGVVWKELLGSLGFQGRSKRYHSLERPTSALEEFEPIIRLFENKPLGLFIHIHDLVSHPVIGGKYRPQVIHFSKDDASSEAAYDDTVLSFDRRMEFLVGKLRALGLWERTILVITSDHRRCFANDGGTIPLLLHLPGQQTGKRIDQIVSTMDVAPTVLEVLGIDIPAWMDGASLIPLVKGRPRARTEPVSQLGIMSSWDQTWCSGEQDTRHKWYVTVVREDLVLVKQINGPEQQRLIAGPRGEPKKISGEHAERAWQDMEQAWTTYVDQLKSLVTVPQ